MAEGGSGRRAKVVGILPGLTYRVELEGRRAEVIAHLGRPAVRNFVRLRAGDVVLVELAAGDPGRGRIVEVLKK
jgi:translation initiation factor IF-1